jgi:hypothetical protein
MKHGLTGAMTQKEWLRFINNTATLYVQTTAPEDYLAEDFGTYLSSRLKDRELERAHTEANPTPVTRHTFCATFLKEIMEYCNMADVQHMTPEEFWNSFKDDHQVIQDFMTYYLFKRGEI